MMGTDLQGRISVIGRETMLGAALVRRLAGGGTRERADLIASDPAFNDPVAVNAFFKQHRPDYVFVAAGKTAGIAGNQQYPADLMIDNMMIATHVIPVAWRSRVKKLLYLASSCTYPKLATQPLQVSSLWAGTLEPTSAAYAAAKLAGMKLCEALRQQHGAPFISAIGADVYGPGDDFTLDNSHVVGALMRRMHDARIAQLPSVDVWGSGTPRREFIYVDDLADACVFAMQHYDGTDPITWALDAPARSPISPRQSPVWSATAGSCGLMRHDRMARQSRCSIHTSCTNWDGGPAGIFGAASIGPTSGSLHIVTFLSH
jgi:GDP-L-fucose synthase